MIIEQDTTVCYCNNLETHEIIAYIKANEITDFHDLITDENGFECGNKCEECHEEGFHADGISLKLLVELVQKGEL